MACLSNLIDHINVLFMHSLFCAIDLDHYPKPHSLDYFSLKAGLKIWQYKFSGGILFENCSYYTSLFAFPYVTF